MSGMNQWEYWVDASSPSAGGDAGLMWQQRLMQLGRDGWELVTDHRLNLQYGQVQYVGTFKRPLTAERLAELETEEQARATAPTPSRVRALEDLVARGALSEEEAAGYVSNERVNDDAWRTLKERFALG
jgi:hypothetical protein